MFLSVVVELSNLRISLKTVDSAADRSHVEAQDSALRWFDGALHEKTSDPEISSVSVVAPCDSCE